MIKDENALFFYTEIMKANNQLIKGWIAKEKILPINKSMYTENTPLYYFELIKDNESAPIAVKISTQSNRKAVQFITEINGVDSTTNTLYPADYNFDGIPDFSLRTSLRDDADNLYENYYLYDKAAGLFKIDTTLSNLPNLEFDIKNKKISSMQFTKKDGIIKKQVKIYRILEDKYVLVSETSESEPKKN